MSNDSPTAGRLLDAALDLAPFEGWSGDIVSKAADACGLDRAEAALIAPRGGIDLVEHLASRADEAMFAAVSAADLKTLKIRARVALAVRSRLESLTPHKEAVRRAALMLALPMHAPTALRIAWATADRAWGALGDPSTDFNWYSKRTILTLVHAATLARWLQDDSLDHADTWAFLNARIENIMQFEKVKTRARDIGERLPDPIGLLAKLRYGR